MRSVPPLSPLCRPNSSAAHPSTHSHSSPLAGASSAVNRQVQPGAWERSRCGGKRPRSSAGFGCDFLTGSDLSHNAPRASESAAFSVFFLYPYARLFAVGLSSVPTLHPSTLSAPVPHSWTLPATVPASGLRARTIGSTAGFNAVPQPSHFLAASVAGAVLLYSGANDPGLLVLSVAAPFAVPITSRSTPAALSMALPTFMLFGNPCPWIQNRESLISNPAVSIADAIR